MVDDQADERDAMASLLHRQDYLVESAADGQEAIDRLRNGASLPALVLLDLNMPVMDGWEFLFLVTQDSSLRHMPVVVISGSPLVPDAVVVPPNVTFMAKPLRPHVIVKLIEAMLQDASRTTSPTANEGDAAATDDIDADFPLLPAVMASPRAGENPAPATPVVTDP